MSTINRRRFLRYAAASAAAGAVVACGGAPAAPTQAPKPAAEPPKPAAAQPTATTAAIKLDTAQATPTSAPAAAPAATQAPAAAPAAGKYREAPQLADLVKAGKLPPVEKRLPDNPRVLKPLQEVGQYGGTWHRAYKGLSDRWGPTKLNEESLIEWDVPDPNTIKLVPNVLEKWEQNKDATEFTFYFRKGMKWSDGKEVTTDDTKFWLEDVYLNKDISPAQNNFVIQQRVGDGFKNAEVSIVDKYTVKIKYPAPNPLLPIRIAKSGGGIPGSAALLAPSHYLKQFHPKYGDKAQIDKLVADKKLQSWNELWGKAGDMQGPIPFWFLNPDLPVLNAWKIDKPTPADPIVMVRNPYYAQVDPDGNQLPYIDTIEHAFFENFEVLKLWIASGKIDMQMRHVDTGAYTFLKENESKGGYKVLNWRAASTEAYYLNLNTPDPVLAKLIGTPDFRQALSIAINRKEINDIVWNGLGKPRQYSPVRGSPEYDEGMEQAWSQFDQKKANELLDGLGLKKGGDGVRQRPDGKPLEITIEHTSSQGSPSADVHELVKKYWGAVGVKTTAKYVERALYEEHTRNGDIECGAWGFDRCSVVKADPGRWTGEIDDGPWAPTFGHWYAKSPYKKEEPPKDHPIRKIWDLWDKTQIEPDEPKRNALFQELIGVHRQTPFAIGTVGELAVPMVAKTNFRNALGGYIADDTLRDYGQQNPVQYYIKK
ncbi:MAG TPA: ABC transporter substrate-binding protein [Chloroflexota bacterium]